jgi:hypothetical protein
MMYAFKNRRFCALRFPVIALATAALSCDEKALSTASDAGGSANSGSIQVTISGENLAASGFEFPPTAGQTATFVDGWSVRLEHLYVAIGEITVSAEPNKSPADQSVVGAKVASLKGSFVVDLHRAGPVQGKAPGDTAWPLGTIENQNLLGAKPFDRSQTYAFGFSSFAPTAASIRVGLEPSDEETVQEMGSQGYTVVMSGTASFKGTTCSPTAEQSLPTEVYFRFGFRTPTDYVNCENPDLGSQTEGTPRGLAFRENTAIVAQVTMHADHPFWSAIEEDAPLRFDPFAYVAKAKNKGTKAAPLTVEDLALVSFNPVRVGSTALLSRSCAPAASQGAAGALNLDPKGRNVADLAGFISLLQSAQGHLNADGLCAVRPR